MITGVGREEQRLPGALSSVSAQAGEVDCSAVAGTPVPQWPGAPWLRGKAEWSKPHRVPSRLGSLNAETPFELI